MRRLRRWLFNGGAAFSAALCLATLLLNVRSRSVAEVLQWPGQVRLDRGFTSQWEMYSGHGFIYLERTRYDFGGGVPTGAPFWTTRLSWSGNDSWYLDLGLFIPFGNCDWWSGTSNLNYENGPWPSRGSGIEHNWGFAIRYRLLSILAMPLPVLWLWRAALRIRRAGRNRRRLKCGQCLLCGYDLRATPGGYPECGMVPKKTESKAQAVGSTRTSA
jgi:hypothetical protein